MERPDRYVVVKILQKDETEPIYKVFATWIGGYTDGDRWKMNSGIAEVKIKDTTYNHTVIEEGELKKVEKKTQLIKFIGYSGSVYECYIDAQGMSAYTGGILNGIIKKGAELGHVIEVLPDDTDWTEIDYPENPE